MHATAQLSPSARPIPWYVWCAVIAVTSAMVGTHWDISWHRSIGRDTFWTPAHMAIYMCGVLAGISCGFLILSPTLRTASPLRDASVKIWGFRGPLGAFIAAWGGVAMITSAPFDNWWHNAYGLDVKILSPPHVLLALGWLAFVSARWFSFWRSSTAQPDACSVRCKSCCSICWFCSWA